MTQKSVLVYGSVFLLVEKAPLGFVRIVTLRLNSVVMSQELPDGITVWLIIFRLIDFSG